MNKKIGIIGGGNLGRAIAEGLMQSGFVLSKHILITKRNIGTLHDLERKGVLVSDKNEEAVRYADLIILAVKPFQVDEVLNISPGYWARKFPLSARCQIRRLPFSKA
jgi:pyrroline-5-carboxylate reductase